MKVVINLRHGGYGLSEKAIDRYIEAKGLNLEKHHSETWNLTSYYTVPYEEYQKVHKADKREGNYTNSNALCWSERDIPRNDPVLVSIVEELGEDADGTHALLKVVEIPDDVEWQIEEYDGLEWVAEKHRTWC